MADTILSPTGIVKVEVGASEGTWGEKLNANADLLNGMFTSVGGAPVLKQANGGTGMTAGVTVDGSFTPSLTASSAPSGVTYIDRSGVYTRIGRVIIAHVRIRISSKGSGGSGEVRFTLPFPISSSNAAATIAAWEGTIFDDSLIVLGFGEAGTGYIQLRGQRSNTGNPLMWNEIDSGFMVDGTITYFA